MGVPRVYFESEQYINNGDASNDFLTKYEFSTIVSVDNYGLDLSDALDTSTDLEEDKALSGVLRIRRTVDVSFTDMVFKYNWVFE